MYLFITRQDKMENNERKQSKQLSTRKKTPKSVKGYKLVAPNKATG